MKTIKVQVLSQGLSWSMPVDIEDVDDYVKEKWRKFIDHRVKELVQDLPAIHDTHYPASESTEEIVVLAEKQSQGGMSYVTKISREVRELFSENKDVLSKITEEANVIRDEANQLVYDKVQWTLREYERNVL